MPGVSLPSLSLYPSQTLTLAPIRSTSTSAALSCRERCRMACSWHWVSTLSWSSATWERNGGRSRAEGCKAGMGEALARQGQVQRSLKEGHAGRQEAPFLRMESGSRFPFRSMFHGPHLEELPCDLPIRTHSLGPCHPLILKHSPPEEAIPKHPT